ncbi:MAG: hypothetical protein J2P57_16665 [Acidimicrobiaceae bacterium]|nr:hypothetical protein [Acidimicrobiaceae bacterium]
MPTFDTPAPITVTVNVPVAAVDIAASERTDTVVEVVPSHPSRPGDVAAAEETQIDFGNGRLRVVQPRRLRPPWFGDAGSVDVHISLPSGSDATGEMAAGSWRTTGSLGACRITTASGDIELDEGGPVHLKSSSGAISARLVTGLAELTTGSGAIRVGTLEGPGVLKNANGETVIGEVAGELRMHAGNGDVAVERAGAGVVVKAGRGNVRLGAVSEGKVAVASGYGKIEVGVVDGVAVWLDLATGYGEVVNELDPSTKPDGNETKVEVRARTGYGDVAIRRAAAATI